MTPNNPEPQEPEDELTPELEADIERWVQYHFDEYYRNKRAAARKNDPTPLQG